MEFNELELLWKNTGSSLDANVSLNRKMIKELTYKKVKAGLIEIKATSYIELIVALFWANYLVTFLIDHLQEFKFMLPAIILLGITIFSTVLSIKKLVAYRSIKADETIIKTQKLLLSLRNLEKMDVKSILVIIPLFSAPFFIVVAKAWFNFDLYVFSSMLANYTAGSLFVAIILFFVLNRYSYRQIDQSIEQLDKFK